MPQITTSSRPVPARRTAARTPRWPGGPPGWLSWVLAVALGCGEPSAPEELHLTTARPVHDALRDMDGWREEGERAARLVGIETAVKFEQRTERVFVTELDRRVAFHQIHMAPGGELGFDLRLSPWGAFEGESAELTLVLWPESGEPLSLRKTLPLNRPAGHVTLPVSFRPNLDARVENAAIQVSVPGQASTVPTSVALLRPWVREPRTLVRPEQRPRQIVVVTLDTVRRDHLGCYGHPRARTPHLDEFAADGVLFEDAYSVTNVTNPAHTSLFTSLHLKDHKVRDNFTSLAPECPTLMERLAAVGFRTAAFVASFNFQSGRSDLGGRFQDFFACHGFHERRAEDVNADLFPWLTAHHAQDLFAWVHYFDAHLPYDPPPPWDTLFEPLGDTPIELPLRSQEDLAAQYGDGRNLEEFKARYLGELAYLDAQFGALVAHLRALGMYEDVTLVVTADHGEALGEHGIYCEHRGLYDAVTAVPLIVKVPGAAPRRVSGLASLLDVYPTLFDYLDLPIDHPVRGHSLRARMEGRSTEAPTRLFAEHLEGLAVSVRTPDALSVLGIGDRQYFPRFATRAGALELYERDAPDPRDLAAERADEASRLRAEMEAFLADALPLEAVPVVDPRYREMLERLGYLEPDAGE